MYTKGLLCLNLFQTFPLWSRVIVAMTRGLSFYRLGEGAELVEGYEVTQEGGAEVVLTNVEEPVVAETVHTSDELLAVE